MMPPDDRDNTPFVQFDTDVVIKDDGRYLIYYSWPQDAASETSRLEQPATEPWSPQSGPADV
jgi:hypothetical protein